MEKASQTTKFCLHFFRDECFTGALKRRQNGRHVNWKGNIDKEKTRSEEDRSEVDDGRTWAKDLERKTHRRSSRNRKESGFDPSYFPSPRAWFVSFAFNKNTERDLFTTVLLFFKFLYYTSYHFTLA